MILGKMASPWREFVFAVGTVGHYLEDREPQARPGALEISHSPPPLAHTVGSLPAERERTG